MHKLAKNKLWLVLFVGTNLLLILLQIYKNSIFVEKAYAQQRLEREKKQLIKHKSQLISELHAQQAHDKIKQFAVTQLGMRKIELKQIQKLEQA
jgi:cell division protein FtsL